MRKLKPGDCGLTKNKQPVCNIGGRYKFVKRASAKGRQALRGVTQAAAALAGKGKGKKGGKRAGVPKGYRLLSKHRKGQKIAKGTCYKRRGILWCKMKGTNRIKRMKTT